MRSLLILLPFFALFVGALGAVIGSAIPGAAWVSYAGWGVAGSIVALWVSLDFKSFERFFTRKGMRYGAGSGLVTLLFIAVVLGVGVLSTRARFNKSYDATANQANTLSDQTVKILKKLEGTGDRVEVLAFFGNEETLQQFRSLIELYGAVADVFDIQYEDPQLNPTLAMSLNLSDANTVVFKRANLEARITSFSEEKLTNSLVKIMKETQRKIYFTKGHGEGQLREKEATAFGEIVAELENNKYEVADLSLLETAAVPDDADLIVVAGPRYDLKEQEIALLSKYVEDGGALLTMVDAMTPIAGINQLVNRFGVNYENDLLILNGNSPQAQMIGQNNAIVTGFDSFNPVTKDFAAQQSVVVLMPSARSVRSLEENELNYNVELVAKTAEIVVKVNKVNTRADLENLTEERIEGGEFSVMAVATGKSAGAKFAANESSETDDKADVSPSIENREKESRVVAVGSTQFATNAGVRQSENRDLFLNIVNYLLQDEDFISIRPKDVTKRNIDVTAPQAQLSLLFLAFIYPFLFLGGGVAYCLVRRRG